MNYFKKIVAFAIISLTLHTCTLFKKGINKPVTIAMLDRSVPVSISSTALNAKYTVNLAEAGLNENFLQGFDSEAKITKNVTFVSDEAIADYILKVVSLKIVESSKVEKISDEKSPYNGQEMVLNTIDVTAEVELTNAKDKSKKLNSCSNTKSRSEKLKNNRDVGDLIMGTNKDNTNYRTKLLDDNICNNLSEDVGRRIWVPITRRIANAQK
ncbi:MAG: hypothetical protein JNJ40_01505 [Bacteroidia bacterium]|nr:hypothetical protein [Bacteroidia bacterium]